MSSSDNSVAARSSTYLNSLVDYILDVKPFRTKINTRNGAVAEEYLFSDSINVKIESSIPQETIFLGADTLDRSTIKTLTQAERLEYGYRGFSRPYSNSWQQAVVSDGQRLTWPIPNISIPKFASSFSDDEFVSGYRTIVHNPADGLAPVIRLDDYQGIPGLTRGVFDQRRWDGIGITDVKRNGVHQQDTIDYFLSHGIYAFDSLPPETSDQIPMWIPHTVNPNPVDPDDVLEWDSEFASLPFSGDNATLYYTDLTRTFGTITNISRGAYEEWLLEITAVVPNVSVTIRATGYQNGLVYTNAESKVFDWPTITPQQFVGSKLTYSYQANPQVGDLTVPVVGAQWLLTPGAKITVANDALKETWSLIKTNPSVFAPGGHPVFMPAVPRTELPGIEIHTATLTNAISQFSDEIPWTITFIDTVNYRLECNGLLPGYPKTISLLDGCSYRNTNIGFTLIPANDGWFAGDLISWTTTSRVTHYKVLGSLSGWMPDATVGQWYWNGKVGFKIPALDYFATAVNTTIALSATGTQGDWESTVNNNQTVNGVNFFNDGAQGIFVIAGNDSIAGGSTNGAVWTSNIGSIFTPTGNEFLVITGADGNIYVSTNGLQWSQDGLSLNGGINDTIFIPNFLALNATDTANTLNCIIAVGEDGRIFTSAMGLGWEPQPSGTTETLNALTYSKDYIVVVGDNGTILISEDRNVWTQAISNTTDSLRDVIFVDDGSIHGILTVVGDNGTILRSEDGGSTWANLGAFSSGQFSGVAYGNGKYVAVGTSAHIAESTDGIVWTRYANKPFNAIAFGNGVFVAVGGSTSTTTSQFTQLAPINKMAEPSTYTIEFTQATSSVTNFTFTVTAPTFRISGIDNAGNIFKVAEKNNSNLTVKVNGTATTNFTVQNSIITLSSQLAVGAIVEVTAPPFNGSATVFNDQYGYRQALEANTPWKDEYVSFQLDTIPGQFEFNVGDEINVIISPSFTFTNDNKNITVPYLMNTEIFPLATSHGAVIFPNIADGDKIIINKAFFDKAFLKIKNASLRYPELGADGDNIPLYFKLFDRLTNGLPSSAADFSDLATYIQAFSAATGQLVFSVTSPRYLKTDRSAQSTLTFSKAFVDKYLPFNTQYSMNVLPDASYGQRINVKMVENLKVYERIKIKVFDPIAVKIVDNWDDNSVTELLAALYLGEGPAAGYWRYQIVNIAAGKPYAYELKYITPAISPGDQVWQYPFSVKLKEGGAFLTDYYDTGGYDDGLYDEPTLVYLPGNRPAIRVEEDVVSGRTNPANLQSPKTLETATTNFVEGLSILQTVIDVQNAYDTWPYDTDEYDLSGEPTLFPGYKILNTVYNFAVTNPPGTVAPTTAPGLLITGQANRYNITMQNKPSITGTWLVAPKNNHSAIQSGPIEYVESSDGTVHDLMTFNLTLPAGITVPFRLWVI